MIGGYVYRFAGLKEYLNINNQISQLDEESKIGAISEFHAGGKRPNVHAGVVAKINKIGQGGLWIWRDKGLKYFGADEYSVYSYYDICGLYIANNGESTNITVDNGGRSVDTELDVWGEKVKTGNFIQVILATSEMGGNQGKLREVMAYDVPLFLELDMEKLCAR